MICADGTLGCPERAPFDGIIITAASPEIPQPLIDQLADGGRILCPVGGREVQHLVKLVKKDGRIIETTHGGVCFVPLIGRYGWGG